MNMKIGRYGQSGFTLVEMVAVVIILAVLAANAIPRFANLSGDARQSSVNGLAGGLRSAISLTKTKWLVANSAALNTVDMNGTGVSVVNVTTTTPVSSTANLGLPLMTAAGIDNILDAINGFTSAQAATGETWWPTGVTTSTTCYVEFNSATGVVIASATTAGCA